MTKKKKDKHASSPEGFNPVGDHSGQLEAAMGVHQCVCVFFFPWQRRHWQMGGHQEGVVWSGVGWGGREGSAWTGCSRTAASVETNRNSFLFVYEVFSSRGPCTWKGLGLKSKAPPEEEKERGCEQGGDLSRGQRGGGGWGRSKAHQGTEWQQESHPKGEGPVYQLPCPHSPFNKPGLLSVWLSHIHTQYLSKVWTHSMGECVQTIDWHCIYKIIYKIDIVTLFCLFITREHLGKYNTKFNTRNIDYTC